MPGVLIDSNVLLDVILGTPEWFDWSYSALRDAADRERLVINLVVYAEISTGYDSVELVETAIPAWVERENIPYEAAFLAAKAYRQYRRRGGVRRSPLPDFFIGAHAAIGSYRLLTRDPTRYRTYFPSVRLIAP
ncbi:MAG TPA: type II toxin-antitoxin system VapC family toxin [Rhizomicrobium sp.]